MLLCHLQQILMLSNLYQIRIPFINSFDPQIRDGHPHCTLPKRILLLKRFITAVIEDIPDENWTLLSTLIKMLTPFEDATNAVQSDSANLFTVYACFVNLLQGLGDLSINVTIPKFDEIHNIIIKYRMSYIDIDVIICSAIFSFDTTHKRIFTLEQRFHANRWFIDFGMGYLGKYYPESQDVRAILSRTLAMFLSRTGIFENMDKLIEDSTDEKGMINVHTVWYLCLDLSQEFVLCVLAILSLPSSEASCENDPLVVKH